MGIESLMKETGEEIALQLWGKLNWEFWGLSPILNTLRYSTLQVWKCLPLRNALAYFNEEKLHDNDVKAGIATSISRSPRSPF
jgi:hypothetical protein